MVLTMSPNLDNESEAQRAAQHFDDRPQFEFAEFQVFEYLGGGTFAETYRATKNGQSFAVKILRQPVLSDLDRHRLKAEFHALQVTAPNLVTCLEVGHAAHPMTGIEVPFIVMPYLDAVNLRKALGEAGGKFDVPRSISVAKQIAAGLEALHLAQIIHRDLKPENVLIDIHGNVWIIDFGLAKVKEFTTRTPINLIPGTAHYLAPEQIANQASHHSDLFALGVVLYEMLTGARPFEADNVPGLIEAITKHVPEPVTSLNPGVPGWLGDLVSGLLEKSPAQRPSSGSRVIELLTIGESEFSPHNSEYSPDEPPILGLRVESSRSAKALADAAMQHDEVPSFVVGRTNNNQQKVLETAADWVPSLRVAVDSRVELCASPAFHQFEYVKDAEFAPTQGFYRAKDLKTPAALKDLVRKDLGHQWPSSRGVFRSTAFYFSSVDDPMLTVNGNLLTHAIAAAAKYDPEAVVQAPVRFHVEAIAQPEDRERILGVMNRGSVESVIIEPAEVGVKTPTTLFVDLLEFCLMAQDWLKVPAIIRLPCELAEIAWAVGIAGVEIAVGKAGNISIPKIQHGHKTPAPRFEFGTYMTSFEEERALKLLGMPGVPEATCQCEPCKSRGHGTNLKEFGPGHSIHRWVSLCEEQSRLDIRQRRLEFHSRLEQARAAWKHGPAELGLDRHPHLDLMGKALSEIESRMADKDFFFLSDAA